MIGDDNIHGVLLIIFLWRDIRIFAPNRIPNTAYDGLEHVCKKQ